MQVITDILGNIIEYLETAGRICSVYIEKYPDSDLIDLRPGFLFLGILPKSLAKSYLTKMVNGRTIVQSGIFPN